MLPQIAHRSLATLFIITLLVKSSDHAHQLESRYNNDKSISSHHVRSIDDPKIVRDHQARPTQFASSASILLDQQDLMQIELAAQDQEYHRKRKNSFDNEQVASNHHNNLQRGSSIVLLANNNDSSNKVASHKDDEITQHRPYGNAEDNLHRSRVPYTAQHQTRQVSAPTTSSTTEPIIDSYLSSSSLELALRQATGDESVFQPLPAINAPGHSTGHGLDVWAPPPSSPRAAQMSRDPASDDSSRPSSTSTTSTTTEQSNIILNHELAGTVEHQSLAERTGPNHLASTRIDEASLKSMTREYPTNSIPSLNLTNNNNYDFYNNQVIYETSTASMPIMVDANPYFFSARENQEDQTSNNHNTNERVASNAWWAIGVGQEFERASNLTRDNYIEYCDRSPLLTNNRQRSLCRLHPKVMATVARGLRMAIDECQSRFASNRWNCSLVLENSINSNLAEETLIGDRETKLSPQIFGDIMRQPNRERSYLNAIIAAGLAQSMTKACSAGELPEECSCDKKIRSKSNKGRVEWVACSDDIDYGARFSRDFTDNLDLSEPDATATIYLHNNEVGRRVFKSATDITCTCQDGENGLCQTKRCWKHLGQFTDVGDELMRRYESATHVQKSNKDPHKLRPVRRGVRRPKRKDLVYIDESPDYCQSDTRLGILGTQNRHCNSTSSGPDSCSLLCCGRGYQVVVEQMEEDCNCKFVWCCQVKCERCKRLVSNDVCN